MDKIILSTDIGTDIDDAFCLLTMLNAGINPEVVCTTNGNVTLRSFVAKRVMDLFGSESIVSLGEAESFSGLVRPFDYDVECNVDDSFIDPKASDRSRNIIYRNPGEIGIIENGIEDMAKRLQNEPHVIFSIAPLSNIARLLQNYPAAAKNIKRLYVMGCRLFNEDTHLEHNIKYDPEAARLVFASDVPITVVPGDVCAMYHMPVEFIGRLKSSAGRYVNKMALSYLALQTYAEYRRLKSDMPEAFTEALGLREWYREIASEKDNAKKDVLLSKLRAISSTLNDDYYALYDPEMYFNALREVVEHIENSKDKYRFADHIVKSLRNLVPKEFSVADAYIPYCFLHYDELKKIRGTVEFHGPFGESYLTVGNRHEIVTDIDTNHFEKFLLDYLK